MQSAKPNMTSRLCPSSPPALPFAHFPVNNSHRHSVGIVGRTCQEGIQLQLALAAGPGLHWGLDWVGSVGV